MTFDQWRDSRERRGGDLREEVYEREGKVRAWLGSDVLGLISGGPSLRRRPAQMELIVHPDDQEVLPALLDHALATKGVQSWLVPEYQEFQRKLLIQRGFREVASYSMLIKTMAVRVERPSLASVEARVW